VKEKQARNEVDGVDGVTRAAANVAIVKKKGDAELTRERGHEPIINP
jgi:hypothetical protein